MNVQRRHLVPERMIGLCLTLVLLGAPSCKEESTTPPSASVEQGEEAVPAVTPYPVLELSDDARGYALTRSFDALAKFGSELMKDVEAMPPAAVAGILEQGMTTDLGLVNLAWLKRDAVIGLLVYGSANGEMDEVILYPFKDRTTLEAALPADRRVVSEGNEWSWSVGSEEVYLNILEGHAVISRSAPRFVSARKDIVNLLKNARPTEALFFDLQVPGLLNDFAPMLEGLGASAVDDPSLAGHEKEQVGQLLALVKSIEHLVVKGTLDDESLVFSFEVQGQEVNPWSLFVGAAASGQPRLMGLAPANSYFVMGSSNDREAGRKLNQLLQSSDSLVGLLGLEGAEKEAFVAALRRVEELQTGDQMVAMHGANGFATGFRGVLEVEDGQKMLAATSDLMGLLWKGGVGFGKEIAGDSIPPFVDLSSFSAAIQSVGPLLMGFGVKISMGTDNAEGSMPLHILDLAVDHKRLEAMKLDAEVRSMAQAFIPEPIQLAMGGDRKLFGVVVGPAAGKELRALLTSPVPEITHKGVQSMEKHVVPGASMNAWFSILRAVDAFKAHAEVRPFVQAMGGDAGNAGVGMSLGRVNAGTLRMNVELPRKHLRRIVRGAKAGLQAP